MWKPEIPCYFFTGGLAGASSMLGLARASAGNEKLARTALYSARPPTRSARRCSSPTSAGRSGSITCCASFKVTSPMNVGTLDPRRRRAARRAPRPCSSCSEPAAGKSPRSSRRRCSARRSRRTPASLLADTAVPVWHEARRELPWIFGASAAASAGAAACLFVPRRTPARRGGWRWAAAWPRMALMHTMETRLGMLGEPYRQGEAGPARQLREGAHRSRRGAARDSRARAAAARSSAARSCSRASVPALVGLQGRLPVGARPEVHRRPPARASAAQRHEGNDEARRSRKRTDPRDLTVASATGPKLQGPDPGQAPSSDCHDFRTQRPALAAVESAPRRIGVWPGSGP